MASTDDPDPFADLSDEDADALLDRVIQRASERDDIDEDGLLARIANQTTSRREALAGLAGGALLGGGAASQLVEPASAGSTQSGTVGTTTNPVDVVADDASVNDLATAGRAGEVFVYKRSGTVYAVNKGGVVDSGSNAATVIQSAIESLPSPATNIHSGTVYLTEGEYTIDSPIKIYGNTNLVGTGIGEGPNASGTTLASSGFNGNVIEYGPFDNARYFASVRWMRIQGASGDTSGHGIYSDNSGTGPPRDLHLAHVFTAGCAQDGMNFDYAHGYRITDCLSEKNDRDGIRILGGDEAWVLNTYPSSNTGNGLVMECREGFAWVGTFENGGDGVRLTKATNTNAQQNFVRGISYNNTGDGVYIDNSVRHDVSVLAYNNGGYGYHLDGTNNSVIRTGGGAGHSNTSGFINRQGTTKRNLINGLGRNAGDPSSGGVWNGNGFEGAVVRDTTNANTYIYNNGGWSQIASA